MAGITDYGFVRKTLTEILESMRSNVTTKLGADWNIATGSIEDQFISVFAEQADQIWQGLEGVVSSNTVDGAEGVYLDDVYARQGVYRQDKTKGGGQAIIQSNMQLLPLGSTVGAGATISATNNINYTTNESVTLDNYASCYKIAASQIVIGTDYTFVVYNANSPSTKTFTRRAISDADKTALLQALVVFANEVILDAPAKAYYEPVERVAYIGYNSATNLPNPFPNKRLYVSVTPKVGTIGHNVSITANTAGYYPLSANNLIALSPSYTGYSSVVNYVELNSGSEVQTDAEFRLSALNIKDNSVAGTPDALKSALLKLEGVSAAEVFENPTQDYIYDISSNLVCSPYTYNVVVLGGNDTDVAEVIYKKGYGNTKRYGTYSTTITNTAGQSTLVEYTRASYFDVGVEVAYKSRDNTSLTETEKNTITQVLVDAIKSTQIGDYVSPKALAAITYQSVSFGRLRDVVVQIKDLTIPSPSFTSNDLLADYDEKPRLLVENITYRRI